mmetsp:Transcript_51213/g.128496  ORF Transcript_51213/g.128496 Transcript_51213/m.128496 type:complete len:224 (+) Transcript_51213:1065-1736(+)
MNQTANTRRWSILGNLQKDVLSHLLPSENRKVAILFGEGYRRDGSYVLLLDALFQSDQGTLGDSFRIVVVEMRLEFDRFPGNIPIEVWHDSDIESSLLVSKDWWTTTHPLCHHWDVHFNDHLFLGTMPNVHDGLQHKSHFHVQRITLKTGGSFLWQHHVERILGEAGRIRILATVIQIEIAGIMPHLHLGAETLDADHLSFDEGNLHRSIFVECDMSGGTCAR